MPATPRGRIEAPDRRRRGRFFIFAILALLMLARFVARYVIEYQWWSELGQVSTWLDMILYRLTPVAGAALIGFAVLWAAHARGLKFAGAGLSEYPRYAWISTAVLFVLAVLIALFTIDTWTVVRYFGGRGLSGEAAAWRDPVFANPLGFYLFELPFYSVLLRLFLALSLIALLIYWLAARAWQLRARLPEFREGYQFELRDLGLEGALESRFLRVTALIFLLGLAARFCLDRYDMLLNEHGFMVGIDYVDERIGLPLQWLTVGACVLAAFLVWVRRFKLALVLVVILLVKAILPRVVAAIYVRPNEISLQRSYIGRHIQTTRSAFAIDQRTREIDFPARLEAPINVAANKPLIDNVRLWDWRAFHDTVTQIQALRPYYVFADSDVDRYTIGGHLRQVLLTPRELDVRQLAGAQTRWINSHLTYTHGYGLVMAEANLITPEGLPVLLIQNAPPEVRVPDLKLVRPEIYYGEVAHEPVYVRTSQPEFNYPAGSDNVHTRYEGRGGFLAGSLPIRIAAAIAYGDPNILLTGSITGESRMMIRRRVSDRLARLAGFIAWDNDPYLVLTPAGRLIWIVDGYTTSDVHPYSRAVNIAGIGSVNYIRNSVKATVDAYDGDVHLYNFHASDPIIQSYSRLFPKLFRPASEMPSELRAHVRYPETLFNAQAEMYRAFHMRDPEAFYNREDLWDIARSVSSRSGRPEPVEPTYMVATLPGERVPEFLLTVPFTPRNKDNLIGMMVARCDGANLGELVFLQLSKQALIFGPMQIEARINQDQNISKDLTLWNQQGSQVLRGQMLVLPVENTFLYIEPIYIQASEARMPQLKKIAVAMGNRLIYTDTYEQAVSELARLGSQQPPTVAAAPPPAGQPLPAVEATPSSAPDAERRLGTVRDHLRRYRELSSQGRWAEAGKELEAIEALVGKR
jgi:uncharacterized membrane protein (UPF0182 family)